MCSSVQQIYHEYDELIRSLNLIYVRIQNSANLIERVKWKIYWTEVRDTSIMQLNEKVSVAMAENERKSLEQQLLALTLSRIAEGFVRETSYSEKGENSCFSHRLNCPKHVSFKV
jgi:hypothetical protein